MLGRRRIGRLHTSYTQFLVVLGITVVTSVTIYICCLPSDLEPPQYVLTKTFITTECEDGRRLGNLMFNYASIIGIGHMLNCTPVMKNDFRLFEIFELSAGKSINMQNTLGSYKDYEEYGRRACAYDVGVRHLVKGNLKLHGYFQSWKYFQNEFDIVRKEFHFQTHIMREAKGIYNEAVQFRHEKVEVVTVIGIHVRRGDTLDGHYSNYGYTTPGKDYYKQAIQYLSKRYKNIVFIVCSDDREWSKEHIRGDNVIYSHGSHDYVDLAVLSLCDHVIISVGSFGWWGAWLANGTTIYYSKWPRPVSKLEYMVTKFDYFPNEWIPLP